MQVAPSVCDVESLRTSNNLHFRSKHHKISLAWLRNVFTLFKFICSYITKPTTSKDANFASDELRNFPTKFGVKFTTSFRSSWFDWQLGNEIAKLVVNFGNSEQTLEPVHQKLCETLCKWLTAFDARKVSQSKLKLNFIVVKLLEWKFPLKFLQCITNLVRLIQTSLLVFLGLSSSAGCPSSTSWFNSCLLKFSIF